VAAIAERRVLGLLAVAQPDLLRLGQIELLWAQSAAFVAAVAHRLMSAQAAGAPPVVTSGQFNSDGLFLVNFGEIFHALSLAGEGRDVKRGRALGGQGVARQRRDFHPLDDLASLLTLRVHPQLKRLKVQSDSVNDYRRLVILIFFSCPSRAPAALPWSACFPPWPCPPEPPWSMPPGPPPRTSQSPPAAKPPPGIRSTSPSTSLPPPARI